MQDCKDLKTARKTANHNENTDARRGAGDSIFRKMSKDNGEPTNLQRGRFKNLISIFEKNEEDIQILIHK